MGHTDPNIYRRHYLNQIVTTDTLACFLGVPSREGLMRLAGHMSLTRDVNAPTALTAEQREQLTFDPALKAVRATRVEVRNQLLKEHGKLKIAQDADADGWKHYQRLQKKAKTLSMKLQSDLLKHLRTEFFATAGARYIEAQQNGANAKQNPASTKLAVLGEHSVFDVEERNQLPALLFPHKICESENVTAEATSLLVAMRTMSSLCRRCSRPNQVNEVVFESLSEEQCRHDEQIVDTFPIIVPGTVCLFCLGDSALPSHARTYAYARRSALSRHVQSHHLRFLHDGFLCPHPSCADRAVHLDDATHFKNHAAIVHNVFH